ncbi:conserved hypothetical protein [Vibrio maritimus]|uniref:Fido domain-containing protein n=1 Tax=Vibrio maritimus TaxID=990268 RepID=A0A090T7Q3_9VIBR|nr:conserved hypothetical protein [Vibrio maritimus]
MSRRRLVLNTCIDNGDTLSASINHQVESYLKVHSLVSSVDVITLDTLQECHRILVDGRVDSVIRDVQNWIGGSSPTNARVVTTPPDMLHERLDDALDYLNDHLDITSIVYDVFFADQLISLHPFLDGNGRVTRTLADALICRKLKLGLGLSATLVTLATRRYKFLEATKEITPATRQRLLNIWIESVEWSNGIARKCDGELFELEKTLEAKLLFAPISVSKQDLLTLLINQPIVTLQLIASRFSLSQHDATQLIDTLVQLKVLKRFLLRQPKGAVIFECTTVFDVYKKLDAFVFEKVVLEA